MNRATRERLAQLSAELGVAELGGITPKEMLLEISRIMFKMVMNDRVAIAALEEDEGAAEDHREAAGNFERRLVMATDSAYKAAQFYHPRFQAVAVMGGAESPGDIIRSMLNEIDDEARAERVQVRQIEHEPLPAPQQLKVTG